MNDTGTTPVPDIVFDELLSTLSGNELKVLLYIIRRTYGFGKNADAISLSQFRRGITTQDKKVLDKGCGLEHNRTILAALASLEAKGYIIAKKRTTNAGDADTTIYKLQLKAASVALSDSMVVTPGNHVVTLSNDGSYPRSRRSLPEVTTVVTPGNQQETVLQETDSQETVLQMVTEESVSAFASTPPPASSSLHWNESLMDISPMDVKNMFEDVDISDAPTIHRMPAISSKEKGHLHALEHTSHLRDAQSDDTGTGLHRGGPLDAPQSARDGGVDAQPTHHAGAMAAADPAVHDALSSAHARDVGDHEIDPSPAQHASDAERMAAPTPRDVTSSPVASQVPPASGKGKGKGREKREKPVAPAIAPEVQAIIDAWCAVTRRPAPLTETLIEAATLLLPCQPSEQDLRDAKGFCFKSNPKWFREVKHGAVTLMDVAKNYEAWQSSCLSEIEPPPEPEPPVIGRQTFYEKLPEPDAEWLAAYYARQNGHAAGRPLN